MSNLEGSTCQCGKTEQTTQLERCKICHRRFCGDCVFRANGQRFCSDRCSFLYLYGDQTDEDDNSIEE
jgi:hypothetical protein